MKNYLLRQESFGGTLFSIKSGKRTYVTVPEFQALAESGSLTDELAAILGGPGEVKVVYPQATFRSGFSFADTAYFEVTRSCNLACKHCFNESGRKLGAEMQLQEQAGLIASLAGSGVQEIRFTGGEPLMNPDIYELIRTAARQNLRISMGTNGTLIDCAQAAKLSASGLDMAIVSIDGVERLHDLVRGAGSFRRTMTGLGHLQAHGLAVRVNIVAMKTNVADIPALAESFRAQGINVFIRRLIPIGRSGENFAELALGREDYARLKERLQDCLERSKGSVRGHYLSEERVVPRIALPFVRSSCSAGQRSLIIDPSGDLRLCGFLPPDATAFVGNIRQEAPDRIWQRIMADRPVEALTGLLARHNATGRHVENNCFALAWAFRGSDATDK